MTNGALVAKGLRCERLVEPLGVDVEHPVFSWVPVARRRDESQTAYRLIVASDPALIAAETPDLWDSGRVESGAITGIAYSGRALVSREQCWWTVQLWDRDGQPGDVSAPATFEMGLLRSHDWQAQWIGADAPATSPLLRREFLIPSAVLRARAYVTGLGYYELRLNGAKVGDRVLDPAQTTYDHDPELRDSGGRPTRIRSPRVLYSVFDVTDYLRRGENAVGLVLGNGWYSFVDDPEDPTWPVLAWADRPRGLVQIEVEVEGGERLLVVSDQIWRAASGPIVYNDPLHGEHYDARLEQDGWDDVAFADAAWRPAALLDAPAGVLRAQLIEPVRVIETLSPVNVASPREGVQIVDFGQHLSGWTRIAVTGLRGSSVALRHAGELDDQGELDDRANLASWPARQTDVYTTRNDGTSVWEPRFTLHGFRYVEVTTTGDLRLDDLQARVVHSDVAASGRFSCADELLNRIDQNIRWTCRASFQGYPQDAADRGERIGFLGDPGWVIEDYLYCFDTLAFWAKWLDDIRDTQLSDGRVPVVSPIQRSTGSISYLEWPDWAFTYPLIAWHLFLFYGDRSIIERHYDGMRGVLDWAWSLANERVLEAGLGDHMEPNPDGSCNFRPKRTPVALTSTAWLYAIAEILVQSAKVLGDRQAAARYGALADSVREAFDATFYDAATARYATASQTAMAMALWLGLVPDERRDAVAKSLIADINERDGGRLTTGTMGTSALAQALADVGSADVMYELATQSDFPSWGNQIRLGATTVWESWDRWGYADAPQGSMVTSRNMKLFIGISKFMYKEVAGISPLAPGWAHMLVKPSLTHRLAQAEARLNTVRGEAAIAWWKDSGRLKINLDVPDTSRADVWLPLSGINRVVLREGADVLWPKKEARSQRSELRDIRHDGDHIRLEAGGGSYHFVVGEAR